jgi:hypothetical protein
LLASREVRPVFAASSSSASHSASVSRTARDYFPPAPVPTSARAHQRARWSDSETASHICPSPHEDFRWSPVLAALERSLAARDLRDHLARLSEFRAGYERQWRRLGGMARPPGTTEMLVELAAVPCLDSDLSMISGQRHILHFSSDPSYLRQHLCRHLGSVRSGGPWRQGRRVRVCAHVGPRDRLQIVE